MKNILEWLKAHLVLVIAGVVGIGIFVGGLMYSFSWSEQLTGDLQKQIDADATALNDRAAQVNYTIPPVGAGDAEVAVNTVPNSTLTKWFQQKRQEKAAGAKAVVEELVAFNRGPRTDDAKTFLVQGLFPKPPERDTLRTKEMARAVSEAPARLLAIVRAGTPPTPEEMTQTLRDRRLEEIMSRVPPGGGEQNLTLEQMGEIQRTLTALRVRKYQERAERLGLYAEPGAIKLGGPIPGPQTVPNLAQCWDWQTAYWAAEDVLRGIAKANTASGDRGIPGAVVKHLESLIVQPLPGLNVSAGGQGEAPPDPNAAAATPADAHAAPLNPAVSVTGRQSGPGTGNGLYDLRNVELTMVVSFRELPRLLDALAQTNLMSVLNVSVEQVDPLAQLNAGYFYGSEHVVRAKVLVETLWLREWTSPKMPPPVKSSLGIVDPAPAPPA